MFKFRCMHCDKKIAVPTEFAGRHVRCPGCAQSTIVPFPSPEELAAAEEEGFRIKPAPSMALASRACKECGAIMPPSGPCIECGWDSNETLKAAFDASLATMLAAPPGTPAPILLQRSPPSKKLRYALLATGGAVIGALAWVAYALFA